MGMDQEQMQRRLAAHAVTPEAPETAQEPETEDKPPEPVVKTVGDVLRHTEGKSPRLTVALLKTIGVLYEDGDTWVYKLSKPLAPPPPNTEDADPLCKQLRFTTDLTMMHLAQMRVYGEGYPAQGVIATWISAFTGKPMSVVGRLRAHDAKACMAIAQVIEDDSGNG